MDIMSQVVSIREKILEVIDNEQDDLKYPGNKSSEKQSQKTGNNPTKNVNFKGNKQVGYQELKWGFSALGLIAAFY